MVITSDGGFRRGAIVPLKEKTSMTRWPLKGRTESCSRKRLSGVIVHRRANNPIHIAEGRDVWWHRELEYVDANCPAEEGKMDSEAPLFILYTSGFYGQAEGNSPYYGEDICSGAENDVALRPFDLQDRDVLLVHRGCWLGDGA